MSRLAVALLVATLVALPACEGEVDGGRSITFYQGSGDRVDDGLGGVGGLPLLQTRVVRGRDPGELREFLAAEAGDSAGAK